jgi:hypothetical protein
MAGDIYPPFKKPKDGNNYEFLGVARVSDPREGKQDIKSLDEQEALYRDIIKRNVGDMLFTLTMIAGDGSGELLTRDDYAKLIHLIETGRYDGVFSEDLGRIVRRMHQIALRPMWRIANVVLLIKVWDFSPRFKRPIVRRRETLRAGR